MPKLSMADLASARNSSVAEVLHRRADDPDVRGEPRTAAGSRARAAACAWRGRRWRRTARSRAAATPRPLRADGPSSARARRSSAGREEAAGSRGSGIGKVGHARPPPALTFVALASLRGRRRGGWHRRGLYPRDGPWLMIERPPYLHRVQRASCGVSGPCRAPAAARGAGRARPWPRWPFRRCSDTRGSRACPSSQGLYTMLAPMVVFAVLCSSRHLVVAADSATAAHPRRGLAGLAVGGLAALRRARGHRGAVVGRRCSWRPG